MILQKHTYKNTKKIRAFTLIELLVVMSIIAILLSILMPSLGRAKAVAIIQKDAAQVRAIHFGWSTWATSNKGKFPTPGLVNRLPLQGQDIKGRGAEDRTINTTDNLHSLCVMENLYSTEALICPSEPNHNVAIYNYDYDMRNVADDQYWDDGFEVDLDDGGNGCNVSYASSPLIGSRKANLWQSGGPSDFAVLGNRGPKFGNVDEYSMTTEIHGGGRAWAGNICWQDNHMTFEETLYPQMSVYRTTEGSVADNLFNIDCVSGVCHFWGSDAWLVIVRELEDTGGSLYPFQLLPELEWDE
jgi:prepilin-type N-terminal cleavage/methylation domain-containing protein